MPNNSTASCAQHDLLNIMRGLSERAPIEKVPPLPSVPSVRPSIEGNLRHYRAHHEHVRSVHIDKSSPSLDGRWNWSSNANLQIRVAKSPLSISF